MKIVRFLDDAGNIQHGERVDDHSARLITGDLFGDYHTIDQTLRVEKLLAPVVPIILLCIGLNYGFHAKEVGYKIPDHPVLFIKALNALQNPGDPIVLPKVAPGEVDYEAELAVAIVAEPKTGAILAMVSLPCFDPGDIRSADPNNFRNHAITGQFEPGSILKPIVAAIAIDARAVSTDEKIFCEYGNYRGRGFGRIGEYGNHEFGSLTVREILVYSSNIGMAKIGQRIGKDELYKGLKVFGFGKKTGLDLPGEAEGLLRPVEKWTGYSVTRIPFGQEISVTAIQLVRAFCILANGGRSVRPYLVKAMVANDGQIIKLRYPQHAGVGYVISPEVARWIVTDVLTDVVNEGTGRKAALEKWQVFGKTGTAQLAKSDQKGYSDTDYIASFVAGAPAEEPAVIVLVSIHKPNAELGKGYTGGTVAAPVAARILEKTLNYLRVAASK